LGNITAYSYDNVGNLVSLADAHGNITNYSYDPLNRLIQEFYADGTIRSFTYDAVGNMIARIDQKGQVTSYAYDALNRRVNIDYPGANDNVYSYDCAGNLATASNANATNSFGYDKIYRLTQSVQNAQTVAYSYDTALGTKTITYSGGKLIKKIRNERKLLTRIENASGQPIIQYAYDAADRIQNQTYLNGVVGSFTFNPNGWITQLTYAKDASQILNFQYGFDKEGNRLFARKLHDSGDSEQYIYDAKSRLTQFKRGTLSNGDIPLPIAQTAYNLDALNNWVTKTTDQVTETRTHNELNQITYIDGTNFSYDANGNLTDDGVKTYSYNAENKLTQVTRNSDSQVLMQCQYDALGRLVARTSFLPVQKDARFIYDGKEFLQLAELDSNGGIKKEFVWGLDLSGAKERKIGIGGLVSMENAENGENSLYLYDGVGNVVMLVDIYTADVMAQYSYSAYGELTSATGVRAGSNPFRFSTKYWLEETDLYDYGYRYYSPYLGRWLSRDQINLFETNRYSFRLGSSGQDFIFDIVDSWHPPDEAGWWSGDWYKTKNTIICDGNGNLIVHEATNYKYGVQECTRKHEQQHVADWLARYGNEICKGRAKGDLPYYDPPSKEKYASFLKKSECASWKITEKCRKEKLEKCCELGNDEVNCVNYVKPKAKFAEEQVKKYCN
jgi:RHS repeat-associated protein